jgi:hypothetical protein
LIVVRLSGLSSVQSSARADALLISIHLGWWLLPAAITVLAVLLAMGACRPQRIGAYGSIAQAVAWAMAMLAATIVSLIAWLLWLVIRVAG